MSKKPIILGIESSCDETAASLITENEQNIPVVLSNVISSQVDVHKEFGGVVPELAARSHIEKIDWIVEKAIKDSGKNLEDIDAVASTAGPGLVVCLSVGLSYGKSFAASIDKPFIAVNHLEGHALSPKLNSKINYPYLLLLISGGHTQYLNVQNLGKYKRLGTTIDDALGEAFDKTAKLLGVDFPGGPQIEILAKKGDCETAVGAYAKINGNELELIAELFSIDGNKRFFEKKIKTVESAKVLGEEVGKILKKKSNNSYKK